MANIWEATVQVFSAAGLASILTHLFTNYRDDAKAKREMAREQLNDFYGPLLSMLTELQARKNFFAKLQGSAVHLQEKYSSDGNTTRAQSLTDQVFYLIDKASSRYREVDTRILQKMLTLFRQKYGLAKDSTLPHFERLLQLQEIWELQLEGKIDNTIIQKHIHEDTSLQLLEADLKTNREELYAQSRGEKSTLVIPSINAMTKKVADPYGH